MRVIPYYDGTNDVSNWRLDILYGKTVVDARKGDRDAQMQAVLRGEERKVADVPVERALLPWYSGFALRKGDPDARVLLDRLSSALDPATRPNRPDSAEG